MAAGALAVAPSRGRGAIEGNVLHPLVVGRSVHLSPLAVLLSAVTGGILFGLFGAFIAVPVAAAIKLILETKKTDDPARESDTRDRDEGSSARPAATQSPR